MVDRQHLFAAVCRFVKFRFNSIAQKRVLYSRFIGLALQSLDEEIDA